ncbi:hypothetical protein MCOR03_002700 [Pyricularia oryzae]|nr:hypothetical protein MCOR26_006047 [Pyricularia oryzae]KAI6314231.1 hypothetical protein MCOR34_005021 [Pyricularia oryzae]KAI6397675.1 hypothetical protein MCOR23_006099 [Pyricularia oryzae]KAI6426836.1 hypothetical protein MCOR24_002755 [Pyricularia oryzae]KAI6436534.1 hypothetical protein MCOR21_001121 [Pyricularia oryzae]
MRCQHVIYALLACGVIASDRQHDGASSSGSSSSSNHGDAASGQVGSGRVFDEKCMNFCLTWYSVHQPFRPVHSARKKCKSICEVDPTTKKYLRHPEVGTPRVLAPVLGSQARITLKAPH